MVNIPETGDHIEAIRRYLAEDDGIKRSFWLDSALEYLDMDRVPQHHQELSDFWEFRNNLLIFSEPWLRAAAERGSLGEGQDLLDIFIRYSSTHRWFTASIAAENGHTQLVLQLVEGHNPCGLLDDVQEYYGLSNFTSFSSWLYIVWQFLIGCNDTRREVEREEWKSMQRHEDYDGWTFLHFAAACGNGTCIEMLLSDVDVDVDAATHKEGYTALHVASYLDNEDIVNLLLEHGSKVDVVDTALERTPLHMASEQGSLASVKALIEHASCIQTLVEAADINGMTALHLASCRGTQTDVVSLLLSQTTQPQRKSGKDLIREKIFMARSLRQWRSDHEIEWWPESNDAAQLEASFNGVLDANKRINRLESEIWSPGGFTALHFAVVYGKNIDTIRVILQHIEANREEVTLRKDDLGLTAADWADAVPGDMEEVRRLFKGSRLVRVNGCSSFKLKAAKWHYKQVEEAEQERKRLQWTLEIGEALLAKRWADLQRLTSEGMRQEIKIDEPVWEHLQWAIEETLLFEPTRQYRVVLIERMLVQLVKGNAFSKDSSTMQRCLMWAIEQQDDLAVVDLVEAIVGDPNCDLMSVAHGCDYEKSPLERATDKGKSGIRLVSVMEQRGDVQKRLYEDRQVYVDYANTILVGAVLIAALAYQGWVQQPQGYAAMPQQLHSSDKGMLVFARCNSLGFFLSMGAVMAAAVAAMPLQSGQFVKVRAKSAQAGVLASLLLAGSVVCEVIGFAMAVVCADGAHHIKGMLLTVWMSTVVDLVLAFWFLARLHKLRSFLHLWAAIFLAPFQRGCFQKLICNPLYLYVFHPLRRSVFPSGFRRFSDHVYYSSPLVNWILGCRDRIVDWRENVAERVKELQQKPVTRVRSSLSS